MGNVPQISRFKSILGHWYSGRTHTLALFTHTRTLCIYTLHTHCTLHACADFYGCLMSPPQWILTEEGWVQLLVFQALSTITELSPSSTSAFRSPAHAKSSSVDLPLLRLPTLSKQIIELEQGFQPPFAHSSLRQSPVAPREGIHDTLLNIEGRQRKKKKIHSLNISDFAEERLSPSYFQGGQVRERVGQCSWKANDQDILHFSRCARHLYTPKIKHLALCNTWK